MNPSRNDSHQTTVDRLAGLGRFLFGGGIALMICRSLKLTTRMPGLPAFWYENQSLWIAIGIGLTGFGWSILWRAPKSRDLNWHPTTPGRRFLIAIVYVSEGCHLCDEAIELLESYQKWLPRLEIIDIRSDPNLVENFNSCVPVIVLDGKVRFRGRILEPLLRRLIEGTSSSD